MDLEVKWFLANCQLLFMLRLPPFVYVHVMQTNPKSTNTSLLLPSIDCIENWTEQV